MCNGSWDETLPELNEIERGSEKGERLISQIKDMLKGAADAPSGCVEGGDPLHLHPAQREKNFCSNL